MKTRQNSICRRPVGGFTLIELLVVLTVIALLIAILLPALGRARQTAQMIQCLSQQRSVGLAFQIYQNESDDYLMPRYSIVGGAGYAYPLWTTYVLKTFNAGISLDTAAPATAQPTAAQREALYCPAETDRTQPAHYGAIIGDGYLHSSGQYVNRFFNGQGIFWRVDRVVKSAGSQLAVADASFLNGELTPYWEWRPNILGMLQNQSYTLSNPPPGGGTAASATFRHLSGDRITGNCNGLYFDGHAASLREIPPWGGRDGDPSTF